MNTPCKLDFESLRKEIVGADAPVATPFGERLMVYADYTASGRCLGFVEKYVQNLQRIYANTHTEDDISGRSMTQLVEQAERAIKRSVNAGPDGRIICVGTGATGAIDKLQQIVGVALPPATRDNLTRMLRGVLGEEADARFAKYLQAHQPVVFVGPYEHHSNEISWREGPATVVEVDLDADGGVDLAHLERLLQDPSYQGRTRIGSFSAASNVTGMRTPVHEIAALLHRHDAIACFDYAASAPYVEIDMNPPSGKYDGDASIDAVFISPHKFLGGPGASGVLVFNQRIYRHELPPSVSAGGTVDYVGPTGQDFIADIEEREKAGTPGVLQILKAGLAFAVKDRIGVAVIEAREHELLQMTLERWRGNPNVELLGNPDSERRISIVSFNLRDPRGKYLHPKFVTTLLNDLFGIQSRGGCSCAGPYGHRLLGIGDDIVHRDRRPKIASHVGARVQHAVRHGIDHALRDLGSGGIIEIDPRDSTVCFVECGELRTNRFEIECHDSAGYYSSALPPHFSRCASSARWRIFWCRRVSNREPGSQTCALIRPRSLAASKRLGYQRSQFGSSFST